MSCIYTAQLLGIPSVIQESLIRSKREMDLAKKCVKYLKGQIETATVPVLTIASVEDLTEALYIMQNSMGLPPYKISFFNEIFYPLYQKKLEE
jgi:hypothetical protein